MTPEQRRDLEQVRHELANLIQPRKLDGRHREPETLRLELLLIRIDLVLSPPEAHVAELCRDYGRTEGPVPPSSGFARSCPHPPESALADSVPPSRGDNPESLLGRLDEEAQQ